MDPDIQRDKSKYCHFHEGYGHDTDRCWDLKRDIEQLIQSGLLKKFVNDRPGDKRKGELIEKEKQNKKKKEVAGVVHVIEGGEPYSNNQKKKRNRRGSATLFSIEREVIPEVSFGLDNGHHFYEPVNPGSIQRDERLSNRSAEVLSPTSGSRRNTNTPGGDGQLIRRVGKQK
ncbi:uncharacterized protein LOC126667663 [Mercurialis annua]|uniref:uncharacterized protein LOC126667663 n=1 Tax=Mercurialis annua TaxID=3986 RepID=UPI00215E7ED5|nr:uncharacterized protein LOC126667663 [Mercurialis annua]